MQKYIKEVFSDYRKNSPILNAEIENINLYKKLNKLELSILCDEAITISQFEEFENYLINRFKVNKVVVDINYIENIQIEQNISDNWNNIIDYITKKAPFSKACLLGSKPIIDGNNIQVELSIKGADFLCQKKFDKGLEHLLKNIYNKNYVISFKENIDEDFVNKFLEHQKEEEQAIINFQEEKFNTGPVPEIPIEELPDFLPPEEEIEDVESKIIMGRSIELKGTRIRISDIRDTTPYVAINGEMIANSLDSRDVTTKTGKKKKLFMFNMYDGSSSITVKGFVDPETFEKIASKIGKSKGIIVDGREKACRTSYAYTNESIRCSNFSN